MKKLILLCLTIFLLHAQPNTILTCEQGNKDDCNDRGVTYGVKGEFGKAFTLYKKACALNSSRGCFNLGFMCMNGQGVKKDFVMAVQYLERAMDLGEYRLATTNLGFIYAIGYDKLKKDKIKALHYFKVGCEKYSDLACNSAGRLEEKNKHDSKALYYYKRGCVLRNAESCLRYGVSLYTGRGDKQNKEVALRAFSLGCKFENASACEALTMMIYKGEGGALPDMKLAKVYRKRACDLGAKDACGEDKEYYKRFD